MKRAIRILLITVIAVLAAAMILLGVLKYKSEYAKTEISRYQSADQVYQLVIYQIGEPQFPFGPGTCRMVLMNDDKSVVSEDVILYNDGAWPNEENFTVSWNDQSVSVTVHGQEMEDVICILWFDGQSETSQ